VTTLLVLAVLFGIFLGVFAAVTIYAWWLHRKDPIGAYATDFVTVNLEHDGGTDADTQPTGPMKL